MSNIDKQALREAAERAMHDDWGYGTDIFHEQVTPSVVLALLDENLQLQREKDATEAVALALRDDMRQAREQLEAAEKRNAEQREYYEGVIADGSKRIAELEAREISLPERSSMLYRTDFHEDYHTVMAYKVSDVIAAIRAAGIKVKGE
ncbi:ead/Ea22-like family protein [Salmonella enterica subsp. enterica serovar Muenchen]|nr:ead/Ea22-like family protein [Salmonella enterica subsp. enterica serovar Muenchen]EHF2334259.1 ead/Ea22-like family protein [Salmonella enterica subsp. enterica serovar Muenchen]EHF2401751.1 ead/Ea22-like family protein [Salmonella enterica subsp. enterica serovar Muenchen]EHF2644983.1 ead/Ea22-like family protein [Salmonella enterica subsp. enterica serovar Muenchen]EHX3019236.1 ead/Ea22-like family protein [Salmonella enterica]